MKDLDIFTRLVRSRPLLITAVMYLIGCITAYHYAPSALVCIAAIVVLLLCAIVFRSKRIAAVCIIIAFLPFGALRFVCDWAKTAPLPDQKDAILSGRIAQTPVWNEETERTICVLEDLSIDKTPIKGKIRLYLRGDVLLLQSIELGQKIQCTAHIWRAEEATNPGQFNFSNFLRLNGLTGYATAKIESAQFSEPQYRFTDVPERFRTTIGKRIDWLFPDNASLARAFILGDRSELSDELRESYSKSGAAHLLAISGMHVSMLAAAISLLLGRFMSRKHAFLITSALLLAYGMLIGFSASLLRAILMFTVYSGAPIAGRYSDAPTRLAAAMFLYLLIRPVAVLETSFILSYGASAGIILLHAPIRRLFNLEKRITKRTDTGLLSFFTRRIPQIILDSLLITAAAQLAILPAVVHTFGSQPIWSFAVNLIAVPLGMLGYLISIIAAITGFAPVAMIADRTFALLNLCVRFFSELPFASVGIARFPIWLVVLCACACFMASDLSRIPGRIRGFIPFTVIIAIFVSNLCSMATTRDCSIVFLDAGQADCAVIRSEGKVYLIDTGDSYTPAADYLSCMNYDLNGVFISHPHSDHAGGLEEILKVCTPEKIYISPNWANIDIDEGIAEIMENAVSLGSEIVTLSAGDTVALSDKTLLEVLSPAAGFQANSANEDSMILRIAHGDCSAVFTGDAPHSVLTGLIGDADLLKVAHHGARDAVDADLLREVSPSVAVIPVGYNNYGHPNADTLKLLDASGARIYRTDQHGAITCRLHTDGSIAVQTYVSSEDANGLE